MMKSIVAIVMASAALSLSAVCGAAATPDATMKQFLTASQKKDKKAVRSAIDWEGLGKSMGADKEKDPDKRRKMMDTLQVVFTEVFANMGKQADSFQVGNVTTKGNEARAAFMHLDPATKKM